MASLKEHAENLGRALAAAIDQHGAAGVGNSFSLQWLHVENRGPLPKLAARAWIAFPDVVRAAVPGVTLEYARASFSVIRAAAPPPPPQDQQPAGEAAGDGQG